jgi:hypothetical protein
MAWKQVNLRQERYDEVAELAAGEGRSVASMVDRLLLAALGGSATAAAGGFTVSEPRDLAGKVKPDPRRA